MNVDTRWFQDRLRDKEISQRRLAKILGTEPSAVSLMFRGKRRMTLSEATDLARVLSLSLDEVLAHAGVDTPKGVDTVPVVGAVSADGEVLSKTPGTRVTPPEGVPENTVALRAEDPGSIQYGWTYFYQPQPGVSAEAVGRLCVVKLASGGQYLRFIQRSLEYGRFTLTSLDREVLEGAKVVSAAPVLTIRT